MNADGLIEQEIENKIKEPTDKELQAFYALNQDAIGLPFESVRDNIRSELLRHQRSEAELALLGRLRATAKIAYELPVPDFPRRSVRVGNAPFTGPKDAPITIVEFADFECAGVTGRWRPKQHVCLNKKRTPLKPWSENPKTTRKFSVLVFLSLSDALLALSFFFGGCDQAGRQCGFLSPRFCNFGVSKLLES